MKQRVHLPVNFTELKQVVHLADVHIRLFKRHAEYREAFEKLYEDLKSTDLTDSVIVIAGDILHAKLDMSPEMITLVSDFLRSLANIAPVIIFDGNHDLNLANPHRMRSLEPIITNINHDNIFYLKYSGVYTVADTQFGLFSVTDQPEDWPSADELTADTKIALYHGPVYGAKTDTKWTISSRHVQTNMFNGYDIVMLGDIHKHQILQEANPIIVYSSSLIQQNHGESIRGHGWCLWNIKDRRFEFRELNNEYAYVTLEIDNDNLKKFKIPDYFPKNLRLRIFTEGIDNTKLKKVLSIIRKEHNVLDVSINPRKLSASTGVSSAKPLDIGNLTDRDVQETLITDWLTTNHPSISDSLLESVLEINKKINNLTDFNDQSRNIHWKPLEFNFSNLFSYGEDNYINFEKLQGTNGIFAQNASGKSSSMEALIFTLFDKTPRAFRGDHIMNTRKKSFYCHLLFEVNGIVYHIERTGKKNSKGSVRVDVKFWKDNDDGTETILNGEDRYSTNANIRNIVGTYEDFILTSLSGQIGNSLFIEKSHSERKNLLSQFMGLNIFESLWSTANEESREIQGILKKFSKEDFTQRLADLQTSIEEFKEDLLTLESEISDKTRESEKVLSDIDAMNSKKHPIPSDVEDIEILTTELEAIKKREELIKENILVLEPEVQLFLSDLENLKDELSDWNEEEESWVVEAHHKINNSVTKLKNDMQLRQSQLDRIKDSLRSLSDIHFNQDCEVCVDNNKSVILQTDSLMEESSAVRIQISEISEKLEDQITEQKSLSESYKEYLRMSSVLSRYKEADIVYHKQRNSLDTYKNNLQKIQDDIERLNRSIDQSKTHDSNIKANQSIDVTVSLLKNKHSSLKVELQDLNKENINLNSQLSIFESQRSEILKELDEISKLETEFDAYRYYLEAICKDGLPYSLISKTIPAIEYEINNILSQIVPFTVALDVDGKNFGGRIVYDEEKTWPLEGSSGMERFISSLAIRVALLKASNLPKSNFLIIDEGMGSLDSEYLHGMQLLFDMLKTEFEFIIIISHLDNIRDMVDSILDIRKEDGYSYIHN